MKKKNKEAVDINKDEKNDEDIGLIGDEDDYDDNESEYEDEEEYEEESEEEPEEESDDEPDEEYDEPEPPKRKNKSKKSSEKPVKKTSKKYEEDDEEEEYDDYDDYDDDDDDGSGKEKIKIIVIAIIIAVLIAIAGIFMYQKLTKEEEPQNNEVEQQVHQEQQTETEAEETEELTTEEYVEETEEDTPIPTSTPKPLPTATPTPTPFPTDEPVVPEYDDEYNDEYDNTDMMNAEPTQEPAGVVFIGDLRFRSMANVATNGTDLWECSASGDYSWLISTAYPDAERKIGKGTKVLISMGLNDLADYQAYADSINAKAQEWKNKGASVYFVAVGPVSSTSLTSNQDIVNFNTYMYNNLDIPFIDAYNYLVQAGFETSDGQTYTDATSTALYNYINGLLGR